MEKFKKTSGRYYKVQNQLRNDCVDYLIRKLEENGNHIDWDDKDLDCSVTISYNGGNHPEYASNLYSTLTGIDLDENGNITFDIEDCSEYDVDDVSTDELYYVCDFLEGEYFPYLGEENKD